MADILSYYNGLSSLSANDAFNRWLHDIPEHIQRALHPSRHGRLGEWLAVLTGLPAVQARTVNLNAAAIEVRGQSLSDGEKELLRGQLKNLMPWRKGPYDLHGVYVDSEWRSDQKWQRLEPHVSPLKDKLVLDVGCGNGYHCWRMAGQGARAVIGIDPTPLYMMQYFSCQHFIRSKKVFVLPFALEALPQPLHAFDTVFSMGVLYHRRSPIDHLMELCACLVKGGELVLETLVIDGDEGDTLMPEERYARMRNVWFIPSYKTVITWLRRTGFADARCVDVCATDFEEQRATEWSGDASLQDFLDPKDSSKTIEGYPAPKRAIFVAKRS